MFVELAKQLKEAFGGTPKPVGFNRAPTEPGETWSTQDGAKYVVGQRRNIIKVEDKFGHPTFN